MSRVVWLLALGVALLAGEESGWRLPLNQAVFYQYHLAQTVTWRSSGDELTYRSGMTWVVALRAIASNGPLATVNATVISIEATLDGPAAQVRVDSRTDNAADDPLYGHLMGLVGVTLTLTVDQPSGRVSAVTGGEALIKNINARHPATVPGEPPPWDAAAQRLYSGPALAAWWSELLAQPATEPQAVALAPPLSGALRRTWTADRFTLALPEGVSELPVQLVSGVSPVTGTLTAVSGSGQLAMTQGLVTAAGGTLRYTLNLNALTQAVEQQHIQEWSLKRWAPDPSPGVTHP